MAMIETVRKNFESCTKTEIEKAKLSCAVQSMIGHPSNKHYKQIVALNDLDKCGIASDNVTKNANTSVVHSRFEGVEHYKDFKICEQ